ncbi:MAG: acetyl-CoA hydrolase/transferase C-terminal domain-containing protein [Bacteroidota bacterium]
MKILSAIDAVSKIKSGQNLFIHSAAMTPTVLLNALSEYRREKELKLIHIHTEGEVNYVEDESKFETHSCFVGANIRKAINSDDRLNYIPIFLSEIHEIIREGALKVDVALLRVSPPDSRGYCSLGTSIDVSLVAAKVAKMVIVELNDHVPRTHGDGFIHVSRIDYAVKTTEPIHERGVTVISEEEKEIGKCVAELIEDGSTLQVGIGGVPDAVLAQLGNHKELGIHTEMFSDGLLPLIESGVITGEHKKVLPGKITTCFAVGTRKLYDYVNDNPAMAFKESSFTNDTAIIRKNPKVVAINSAIELDLTGQVCADSIGTYQYSGVGGQMDFIRGASLSDGGKPIIALTSQTKKGESKIMPTLKPGASVTTTRAHVHWVVTEYGAVNLFGKDLVTRAKLLTSIAHPKHREMLTEAYKERYHTSCNTSYTPV